MKNSVRVCVVMPAYNEEDAIGEFLEDLSDAFAGWGVTYVVVDDASTDGTSAASLRANTGDGSIHLQRNVENQGHGPTTYEALQVGSSLDVDIVLATDGDGQVSGEDLARLVEIASLPGVDVVEGVRVGRDDPLFRRVTSLVTNWLVCWRCGTLPRDANTPHRAYKVGALQTLLEDVAPTSATPNLAISSLSRSHGLRVSETNIQARPRRGQDTRGTSWKARTNVLPSRRFIAFCVRALYGWARAPLSRGGISPVRHGNSHWKRITADHREPSHTSAALDE